MDNRTFFERQFTEAVGRAYCAQGNELDRLAILAKAIATSRDLFPGEKERQQDLVLGGILPPGYRERIKLKS